MTKTRAADQLSDELVRKVLSLWSRLDADQRAEQARLLHVPFAEFNEMIERCQRIERRRSGN